MTLTAALVTLSIIPLLGLVTFVQFDDKDVVRHPLVQRIVKAYERYNLIVGVGRQMSLGFDGAAAAMENGKGENGRGENHTRADVPAVPPAPLA